MNPLELYRSKLISIPEAVSLVQSHQSIATAMAAAEPVGLLSELGNHRDRLEDVTVEARHPASARTQLFHLARYALADGCRDRAAIDQLCRHQCPFRFSGA